MHDDSHHPVRTIDWRSVFPFTRLFNAFRIAIHPAKLLLALTAILLVYTVGRSLDGLWSEQSSAVLNEIEIYEGPRMPVGLRDVDAPRGPGAAGQLADEAIAAATGYPPAGLTFREGVDAQRKRLADARDAVVERLRATEANVPANPSYRQVKDLLEARRDRQAKAARDAYDASAKDADARRARDAAVAAAYESAAADHRIAQAARGRGVFATFMDYETTQVDQIARGVLHFDWSGPAGVFPSLRAAIFTAPGWAFSKHPLHAVLMTFVMLFAWSVFGGAIARLAAVHVARDEKISVRQALRFSSNKLMSFFAAPVMPMLIVGAIALVLAVVGLLTEIPYVGGLLGVVIGAGFVVALFVGVLLACSLIGTVAGFNLMYPTIAVEGSDAFDAVSRSFSYVFARPWKVLFYALLSLAYAAVTYVVLRMIVYLTLALLHGSLNAWTRPPVGTEGRTSFAHAWTGPQGPFELAPAVDFFNLTLAEKTTAFLLSFWLYLFVSLLAAYLLSFFISSGTITYYLLRRDVDATPVDDVYLDPEDVEAEDEFDDVAGGGEPLPPPPASATPHAAPAAAAATTRTILDTSATPPPTSAPVVVTMSPPGSPSAATTVESTTIVDTTSSAAHAPTEGEAPKPAIRTDGAEPSQNPT